MPEISRFFGIVIKMFYDDHNPPHFHAEYGDYLALIDIRTLSVFSGRLPPRVTGFVIEWATLHQQELLADWDKACAGRAPKDRAVGIGRELLPLQKLQPHPLRPFEKAHPPSVR